MVDAVVHLPFGSYPGAMPGMYGADPEHTMELMMADRMGWEAYMKKWVFDVADHAEMLEKVVGAKKLLAVMKMETVKEGYHV
jgi:glutaconate CoA-transferase subunit A